MNNDHIRTSAQQALFEKTLSLYRAYRVQGCLGPVDKTVQVSEEDKQDEWVVQTQKSHRGHDVETHLQWTTCI